MAEEYNEYTFLWFIENYSYSLHRNGEKIISPEFTADGLEGTAWCLWLFPRGGTDKEKGNISLFLTRSKVDDGPEEYPLNYELSVLAADRSALQSMECQYTFATEGGYGALKLAQTEDILLHRKSDYLPNDILTLRVIWKVKKGEGNVQNIKEITARTHIRIEQISFCHEVEHLTSLESNEKKTIQIKSSTKGHTLSSSIYISDDSDCHNRIMVDITSSNAKHNLCRCNLYLFGKSKKMVPCGEADNRLDASRKTIQKLPLSLTKVDILKMKDEFLPDDKLTVLCECIFSSGNVYKKIEKTQHKFALVGPEQIIKSDEDIFSEKLSVCPSALDDLKGTYSKQLLTDLELKTKTKSFPAHKLVLCSRSSVFQAMFTSDMKEKNKNCIQIDDLKDDTVQRLLHFLYSDELENLDWESAIQLYYAADKYAIEKLKLICSLFLLNNLSISNSSELLLLADTHNDSDLKKLVEDFIFKREKEVFCSEEWGNLLETNPLLASKTMRLKYMREM